MTRPCFLVIDREFAGSISTRKLVIETAKFNVITAYSGKEAIATLDRFPGVNGIVLDAGISDVAPAELCRLFKDRQPKTPIVLVGAPGAQQAPHADHYINSFDPASVLELLRSLEPARTAEIERHDAFLEDRR